MPCQLHDPAMDMRKHACMHPAPHTCQLLWKMACFSSSHTWGLRYQEEGGVQACKKVQAYFGMHQGLWYRAWRHLRMWRRGSDTQLGAF